MATQCRSSKCTAERKGFRRELDSWRHRLIHCVGFESILEGIYGPRLLQDLNIFDDCEPEAVDDWLMDATCSFCNLHLEKQSDCSLADASPPSPPPAETPPPQGLSTSDKLQCQADRFLHAVFRKKEFPQSGDPSIPQVAQELMCRMIRQFAIEYATKSQTQEGPSTLSSTPAPTAVQKHADLDGPLDLTVSRTQHDPEQVDGVLDLSKKTSEKLPSHETLTRRPLSEECVERSSAFAKGLLSKALKDIQSGLLDIHKAAILYGIPQKTLRLQMEALVPEGWAGEPMSICRENRSGLDGFWWASETRLVLQRVAAWAQSQSEHPTPGKPALLTAENLEYSSYLHHLTLQRMVSQLQEQNERSIHSETPTPPPPPQSLPTPATRIRIPQVRTNATPKPALDLAGLVDAVYQATRTSPGSEGTGAKLKTILPKQNSTDASVPHLLQADVSSLCLNLKNGSLNSSLEECSGDDGGGDRRDKQPRKKRGRYRQYDHDILEEAINMVMNGKMSVSKAQGVYGIPHSTLEYKVKERLGTLKTPPKKKPRPTEAGAGNSGTTTNASNANHKNLM